MQAVPIGLVLEKGIEGNDGLFILPLEYFKERDQRKLRHHHQEMVEGVVVDVVK